MTDNNEERLPAPVVDCFECQLKFFILGTFHLHSIHLKEEFIQKYLNHHARNVHAPYTPPQAQEKESE